MVFCSYDSHRERVEKEGIYLQQCAEAQRMEGILSVHCPEGRNPSVLIRLWCLEIPVASEDQNQREIQRFLWLKVTGQLTIISN